MCYSQGYEPQHLRHSISSPSPAGFYQRYHNPFLQPSYLGTPGLTHAGRALPGRGVASDIRGLKTEDPAGIKDSQETPDNPSKHSGTDLTASIQTTKTTTGL